MQDFGYALWARLPKIKIVIYTCEPIREYRESLKRLSEGA